MLVNDPPSILTEDVTVALEDETYWIDYIAIDPDIGDSLTWDLLTDAEWLSMDETTGVLSGTPTNDDVGTYDVEVKVKDLLAAFDVHTFVLVVENTNDAPQSGPPWPSTDAQVGTEYRFTISAEDIDEGDVLSFGLREAPNGMSIVDSTGEISWTPLFDQLGDNPVVVEVSDGRETTTVDWTINVVIPPDNVPPTITSEPSDTSLMLFETFYYNVTATDPETGDALTFALVDHPEDMAIDPTKGHLVWTSGTGDEGAHNVTVRVFDGWGAYTDQEFTLTVGGPPDDDDEEDQPSYLWVAIPLVVVVIIIVVLVYIWRR